MFFLGLLLPICYVAGITGVQVLPQWALLSFALPLFLRQLPPKAFLLWFAFGGLSLVMSLHWITWLFGISTLAVWGLCFQLGRETENPLPLFLGMTIGLWVSTAFCVVQWLGYTFPPTSGGFAGLSFNTGVLSVSCGFVVVALGTYRQWWLIPSLIPTLIFANSRAGWFAIAIGLAAKVHPILVLAILAACGFLANATTDPQRLQVWGITLQCLSYLPHGAGSFIDLFYQDASGQLIHPEYAHNDYLQLWYEYGAFALIPYLGVASGLAWRTSPLVYASAAAALVEPILYNPVPAFVLCFALGHSLRGFELRSLKLRLGRSDLLPWRRGDPSLVRDTFPVHMDPS